MLGVLVAFLLSWLVVWLIFKEHITVLGIIPNRRRLKEFLIGLLVMALFCTINILGQAYFTEINYVRNANYRFLEGLNGTWWTFKAALFEELIFRGAILYVLIKKLGAYAGCIISAIAFGIYHWFSYQMFGRGLIPMAYVFLLTGAGGWMFAYAFYKTKSLLVPLGLHFGWIVVSIVVFSAGPLGNSMFVVNGEASELGGWEQLLFFLFQTVFVPGIVTWYLAKKYKSPEKSSN
jgi:membrane protease YdiL (CAAX protease family)